MARPTLEQLSTAARRELTETGALLEGHFLLSSGLHSAFYLQAMRLLQHPARAARIAAEVATALPAGAVATLAPAIGGIVWGYALAAAMPGTRALFAERVDGRLSLRRGFALEKGESVILAEDVTTTGGTVEELRAIAESHGARVLAIAAVVDRSGGRYRPGIPLHAWASLDVETHAPADCPLCRLGTPAIKPGSRGLK